MGRGQSYKVDDIIAAIRQGQTPSGAADILGCHPDTVRGYAKRYPSVKAALDAERQTTVDLAEKGLRTSVMRGDAWAVAFALKTLAKDVYSERQEVTGKDGEALVVATRVIRKVEHGEAGA